MKVSNVTAREILDSRGVPTVEAEITLENGVKALGQVPSGVSTGKYEAVKLQDKDKKRYNGKGVLTAVENIKTHIKKLLVRQEVESQAKIDQLMIKADGTENKKKLGGNAICAVSMAVARAAARAKKIPLFRYFGQLSGNKKFSLPCPQILMLEGGKHGNWATDIQEFMIVPQKNAFESFSEMLRASTEIYHALGKILEKKGYSTGVGFEGAFCPPQLKSNEEAFELIIEAAQKAGYRLPEQVVLAIDAAASEFLKGELYILKSEEDLKLAPHEWTEKIISWIKKYPIAFLEDPLGEEAWSYWTQLNSQVGDDICVIGDDLLTTNASRIKKGIEKKACNGVVIKPNQVGTITETLEAVKLAHFAGFTTIVSHRAGETNDDLLADLAVGVGAPFCKFGAPARGERVAKYNRLLRIEEKLALDKK